MHTSHLYSCTRVLSFLSHTCRWCFNLALSQYNCQQYYVIASNGKFKLCEYPPPGTNAYANGNCYAGQGFYCSPPSSPPPSPPSPPPSPPQSCSTLEGRTDVVAELGSGKSACALLSGKLSPYVHVHLYTGTLTDTILMRVHTQ